MKKIIIRFLSIFFFLVIWFFLTKFEILPFPSPIETIQSFFLLLFFGEPVMNATLIEHAGASLLRVVIGTIIASCFAIPLGILIGWYKKLDIFSETIVELLRPIPPIAWIPVSIILFGRAGPIFIVFVGVFFPLLLNVVHGVKNMDSRFVDLSKTFNANTKQIISKVVIPASMPSITTGIRIGLGVGWMCIIAAEMISLTGVGLGYFIITMYDVGHKASMFSGMIMIGIIGYLMNKVLLKLNRYVRH